MLSHYFRTPQIEWCTAALEDIRPTRPLPYPSAFDYLSGFKRRGAFYLHV
jgi:hypothetical protein